jgi:protein-arginine kinase
MKSQYFTMQGCIILSLCLMCRLVELSTVIDSGESDNHMSSKLGVDLDFFHKIKETIRLSTSPHQLLIDLQREFDLERERNAMRVMDLKRKQILRKMENRLTGTSFFRDFLPGRY